MLKLPNELSIVHVEVLHQDLLSELNNSRDICLDISDVMSADTASFNFYVPYKNISLLLIKKLPGLAVVMH